MGRRTSRITHDEVRRMVKAVQSTGLSVGRVVFDGETVSVIIGNPTPALLVDNDPQPENFTTFEQYRVWRDRGNAGAD